MADHLDMSLDQIIRKNNNRKTSNSHFKPNRRRTDGFVQRPGPDRRVNHFRSFKPQPYPMLVREEQKFMLMPVQGFEGGSGSCGTKLYVSNLDSGVSNGDIKLLFSEVGELMRYSIHYDKSGRSKGTAEVVYARHDDALEAIKRYNNNNLDGRPMKIEIVGADALVCTPVPSTSSSNITYHPTVYYASKIRTLPGFGTSTMDRGGRHGHGMGQRQLKQNDMKVITAEELNADLDKFRAEDVVKSSTWSFLKCKIRRKYGSSRNERIMSIKKVSNPYCTPANFHLQILRLISLQPKTSSNEDFPKHKPFKPNE